MDFLRSEYGTHGEVIIRKRIKSYEFDFYVSLYKGEYEVTQSEYDDNYDGTLNNLDAIIDKFPNMRIFKLN